jgi:Cu-processing system permease protein
MNAILAIAGVVIKELYRRKDFYVLFFLTVLVSLLMGGVNFFNEDRIVRYLKELCLLLIWVSMLVIAITTTARQIPAECESRTIFPLLAKPLTRAQVVLGKFLGCWLACGLALLCFYVFFGVLAGSREGSWLFLNYFQAAVLHWAMLAIVIALTLLGSLVFAAPSSNATICFTASAGILLLGRYLNVIALQQPEPQQTLLYAMYYVIPHLELFDVRQLIVHNWPLVHWDSWALALLYAAAYTASFLFAACLAFRRKELTA